MSTDDLSDTITPKSDQLNADDLLTGPITVKITNVSRGAKDQPISIDIPPHRPYKPCKSMRRVMVAIWGKNGKEWIGKSLTLYCDPTVKYGGVAVGGIRISHMSNINNDHTMMLTATRGKKANFTVNKLIVEQVEFITDEQADELLRMIDDNVVDMPSFLKWLKIPSLEDMPKTLYKKAIAGLEKKKQAGGVM